MGEIPRLQQPLAEVYGAALRVPSCQMLGDDDGSWCPERRWLLVSGEMVAETLIEDAVVDSSAKAS